MSNGEPLNELEGPIPASSSSVPPHPTILSGMSSEQTKLIPLPVFETNQTFDVWQAIALDNFTINGIYDIVTSPAPAVPNAAWNIKNTRATYLLRIALANRLDAFRCIGLNAHHSWTKIVDLYKPKDVNSLYNTLQTLLQSTADSPATTESLGHELQQCLHDLISISNKLAEDKSNKLDYILELLTSLIYIRSWPTELHSLGTVARTDSSKLKLTSLIDMVRSEVSSQNQHQPPMNRQLTLGINHLGHQNQSYHPILPTPIIVLPTNGVPTTTRLLIIAMIVAT